MQQNITEENKKLATTICSTLDFKHVIDTIMKILGVPCENEGSGTVET